MQYEDSRQIATPEGVQLALPLAGIASRFMALMLDLLIIFSVAVILLMAALVTAEAIAAIIASALVLVFYIGYFVLCEVAGGGRTVGMRAAGLRVVMDGGGPVGLRASLIRNLMLLIEGLPLSYAPAIVSVLATKNNQRLGDLAAGTLVVRDIKAPRPQHFAPPPLPPIPPERYASWDVTAIGDNETAAVRAFLERRQQLDPNARAQIAAQLAGRLRPLVAGVRPGLPDEAFLEHLAAAKSAGALGNRRS
ncbi:MAG TPA: RDD family protein [Solirubrobacter sp.]|jgi:uncharacterized RDD family membrane protein YckC|nr:RDD family protein [Solirubrobacter sp.]